MRCNYCMSTKVNKKLSARHMMVLLLIPYRPTTTLSTTMHGITEGQTDGEMMPIEDTTV